MTHHEHTPCVVEYHTDSHRRRTVYCHCGMHKTAGEAWTDKGGDPYAIADAERYVDFDREAGVA